MSDTTKKQELKNWLGKVDKIYLEGNYGLPPCKTPGIRDDWVTLEVKTFDDSKYLNLMLRNSSGAAFSSFDEESLRDLAELITLLADGMKKKKEQE